MNSFPKSDARRLYQQGGETPTALRPAWRFVTLPDPPPMPCNFRSIQDVSEQVQDFSRFAWVL
jgi:hypothetical protein